MKPGITLKLFLAILAACALAAAAMAVATRLSFQSGFFGYLNQVEAQRLDTLVGSLADEYRRRGDWEFLRGDYGRLRELAVGPQVIPPRLTLLDAQHRPVVGNLDLPADAAVRPILVDDRIVGWISAAPFRRLSSAADLAFQQEQLHASLIIAALALALAGVVAMVLARAFLQPLKRLATATHRLAAGHYGTRVEVGSRDELGRLGEDFNRLAQTLERNEQLRRRFMADVSHELRTPLAVLKGELEAIEDGVRPLSREALVSLNGEVAHLGKLVEDLYQLALADVGALTYRRENIDVTELLEQAIESFGTRMAERGFSFEKRFGAELPVVGDPQRLSQAFRNLLENSVRYANPGAKLRIGARREDDRIVVDIEDSAPGVPSEALPHLFERFYRVDASRNRAHGGAGLGLAIVRTIVEAHQGEIAALRSALGGLDVRITLPAAG